MGSMPNIAPVFGSTITVYTTFYFGNFVYQYQIKAIFRKYPIHGTGNADEYKPYNKANHCTKAMMATSYSNVFLLGLYTIKLVKDLKHDQ